MTREEYLKELDANLIALSKEERDMAVSFYSEYFDDAGPENEQATIEELGKPYNLARSIIGETSAYSRSEVYLKYKESKPMPQNSTGVFASLKKPDAFQNHNAASEDTAEDVMPKAAQNNANGSPFEHPDPEPQEAYNSGTNNANGAGMFDDFYKNGNTADREDVPPPPPNKKQISGGLLALFIVLGVFVGIPLLCGLIPTFVAIVATMFVMGIVSILCIAAAVICLIVGLTQFAVSVPRGVGCILASLVAAGIGLMMLSVAILFFFKFLPWLIKSIVKLCRGRRTA